MKKKTKFDFMGSKYKVVIDKKALLKYFLWEGIRLKIFKLSHLAAVIAAISCYCLYGEGLQKTAYVFFLTVFLPHELVQWYRLLFVKTLAIKTEKQEDAKAPLQ